MANNIQLDIKINAETGALEVAGAKFEGLARAGDKAQGSFSKLTGEAGSLVKSLLPLATAGGVIAFFTESVKGAEAEAQALNRLKTAVEALGKSWDSNKGQVQDWGAAIQATTRFSDSEAYDTLARLARVTGDVEQAQRASQLAMSLSVASGRDLSTTTEFVTNLINGNARALKEAEREFGAFTGGANTAQGVLDNLQKSLGDAAFNEESLTKSSRSLKNAFGDLMDTVGAAVTPGLTVLFDKVASLVRKFDQFGLVLAGIGAKVAAVFQGDIKTKWAAIDAEMEAQFNAMEAKLTAKKVQGAQERGSIRAKESEEDIRKRQESMERAQQLELELDQKLASLGNQTLQKKLAQLEAETAARRNKINKEIADEAKKAQLLAKLDDLELKQKNELAKAEVALKIQTSFQIAETAVQTLQIINSLGDKGSSAERTRAKALLALQQSIAIGWAWVNAMKVGGPFATGLAAATTAMLVAQFAAQSRAIDKAGAAEKSGLDAINIRGGVPGIDLNAPVGTAPGGNGGFVSTGGGGSVGGGGGGGGGQTVIINVGGISANFDISKLSTDNVDAVMLGIYEKLRQATIEGVQMAVAMRNLAERNSSLAV